MNKNQPLAMGLDWDAIEDRLALILLDAEHRVHDELVINLLSPRRHEPVMTEMLTTPQQASRQARYLLRRDIAALQHVEAPVPLGRRARRRLRGRARA